MRIGRFAKDIWAAINDKDRDLYERVFLIYTIISEITALIALIGDMVMGENMLEIIALCCSILFAPVIIYICFYMDRLDVAIKILAFTLVAVILPGLFFFGGGVEGGGILWVIFAFMYVGLIASGTFRKVVLVLLILVTTVIYMVQFYFPELVYGHSRAEFYVDSYISIILVGGVCFVMLWVQARLYKDENERARKEAERAEELTRSQNRFFSSMSHEIRTPINSILGLNELILRDPTDTDEIVRNASGIQGAGKMLLALINDLLDFSKMEAGSMDIVPVDYRIGDMLSEIVNMIWLRASDKGLKLNVSIDPTVPSVLYGDEVRIKQVIINILNNAVKYTQKGSVELRIESENIDEDKTMLRISVSDTGMGIRKEVLPYLFDAFKRVDEENNRRIEGTGLGLSIVKQIVDLMGGTVAVNSVYGEGSTFTVTIRQGISDCREIGELNIHNQQVLKKDSYEASFSAPDARILIVDDNELNLEVECKLLADTEMTIDKASSGKDALKLSLNTRYDAILMDHLMPEMDGIECVERLRSQTGGLNINTPVIVLTANAGNDNRELYNRAGFDGCLVKPVSGRALEEALIKHISSDKLILSARMMSMQESINTTTGYSGKVPVIITACSVCDLPHSLIKKLGIPIIPAFIHTEEGAFKDGVQMDAGELIRYMESGRNARSASSDEAAYTDFFARVLKKAHHIIHISIIPSMSDDYKMATAAAESFDNVTVINSECLSSATGLLVMIAHKLAQQNIPVPEIVDELKKVRGRIKCSFVIDTTEYMTGKGFIKPRANAIASTLGLHPSIKFKDGRYSIGGIWIGSTKRAYGKYIRKAFPVDIIPDPDIVFVTFVDIPVNTLMWIREEISKIAYFKHVVFKQASAAISANCGPGTFGILYFVKTNKSYNIASYIDEDDNRDDDGNEAVIDPAWGLISYGHSIPEESEEGQDEVKEDMKPKEEAKWYQSLGCIDGDIAIKNSGSEEALKTILKIFYDSIPAKSSELDNFYLAADWSNYTIKVHALKSSAKLVGAMDLSKKAELLEAAGKEENIGYINENHPALIREYREFTDLLADLYAGEEDEADDRPLADDSLMQSVYEGLMEAADVMDCTAIEDIFTELDAYSIPEGEKEKCRALKECADNYDYDGILEVLKKG